MKFRYMVTGFVVVLSFAGCQRTSYDYNNSGSNNPGYTPPLQAQPVPSVQSGALPPSGGAPGSQFPSSPSSAAPGGTNVAFATPPATALDVTKESMVGNWLVSNGGANCDMFLTLTNLGSGTRGGTRSCQGELTTMSSWEVLGKVVLFKDRYGNTLGRVYKSTDARFDGTTNSGQPLSLSR